jgi:ferredoxin-NADP reductase
MLESLSTIKNPLTRSVLAAATALSVVTLTAGVVVGITNPKSEAAQKSGVYASLIATVGGALFGLAYRKTDQAETQHGETDHADTDHVNTDHGNQLTSTVAPSEAIAHETIWSGWRNFVVVRKVKESEEITSFYLKPDDGGPISSFQPGQFLTLNLTIPGQTKPVIRTYSLSDYPDSGDYYRLSIKREPAPKGSDVPPGLASNFMHDQIQVGSVIPVKPPAGKFVLNVHESSPILLISNGVGITPMISMAKACIKLNPRRSIWFLHGARSGAFHAFRDEINALAQTHPNLHVHVCYSQPSPDDDGQYHSKGYVDMALIQDSILPELKQTTRTTNADYFLCGSPAFLRSLQEGLKALSVPANQIFFESFGSAPKTAPAKATASLNGVGNGNGDSAEIVFTRSGKTLTWHADDGSILEFAEANDLDPVYSCRQGICLTCMCPIQAGEVEYEHPPIGTPDDGSVLICIAKPKTTRVVLDL